tara:strand:+ start:208 stop:411 length:204 start_codon:yes stop_codon:yes gene_type:complete
MESCRNKDAAMLLHQRHDGLKYCAIKDLRCYVFDGFAQLRGCSVGVVVEADFKAEMLDIHFTFGRTT